jgi:thioesterase domain-containing protein
MIKSRLWQRVYRSYETLGRALPRVLSDVREFNSMAARAYLPQAYDGPITLFWASRDLRASYDLVEGWRALAAGEMEVHEIPGTHLDIIKEPHVAELARKLRDCLAHAQTTHRSNRDLHPPTTASGGESDKCTDLEFDLQSEC